MEVVGEGGGVSFSAHRWAALCLQAVVVVAVAVVHHHPMRMDPMRIDFCADVSSDLGTDTGCTYIFVQTC